MEFLAKKFLVGEAAEREDESRNAPAKSGRRAREPRREGGTVRSVSASEPAILFACDICERHRREKFRKFANLHRDSPADFVTARANNYFSAHTRFSWLQLASDLAESEFGDA